jgi:archaellum component FlaC
MNAVRNKNPVHHTFRNDSDTSNMSQSQTPKKFPMLVRATRMAPFAHTINLVQKGTHIMFTMCSTQWIDEQVRSKSCGERPNFPTIPQRTNEMMEGLTIIPEELPLLDFPEENQRRIDSNLAKALENLAEARQRTSTKGSSASQRKTIVIETSSSNIKSISKTILNLTLFIEEEY